MHIFNFIGMYCPEKSIIVAAKPMIISIATTEATMKMIINIFDIFFPPLWRRCLKRMAP